MDYLPVHSFKKGIVFELLYQSFEPLMNLEMEAKLRRYDGEVFEHPETIGASLFLTQFKNELIGMVSWDPRQFPKAIIGYNCIVPGFQGKGFGKQQLFEMLKRLKDQGFIEAYVNTGDHPFYIPSQRMYTSCGFDEEIQRHPKSSDLRYGTIEYRIDLKNLVNPVNPV